MGLDDCVRMALREGILVQWQNLALYVIRENIITPVAILKHSFRRGRSINSLIFRFSRGSWHLNPRGARDGRRFLREEESESMQRQEMERRLEKELTGRLSDNCIE
jgi:hypothetical protein